MDAGQTANIGDLMGIADRRGHAVRADAAVKLERGVQRGFDMQMGVDESGHQNLAGNIHNLAALILPIDPDNHIAADRHIARHQIAGDHIQYTPAPQHQIGRLDAAALCDAGGQGRAGHRGLLFRQGNSKAGAG